MTNRKVFISQPMGIKSNAQIASERAELVKRFESEGFEIIDTILDLGDVSPLVYLGESIKLMADAGLVYMMPGWEKARGCLIEWEVAKSYGLEIIYG